MKHLSILVLLLLFLPVYGEEIKTDTELIVLGKTEVKIETMRFGEDGQKVLFINLHENESTSVAAAKEYLVNRNGHLVSVKHDSTRNISFVLKNVTYQFDPNRMFTDKGRIANLKLLNKQYNRKAAEVIEELADKIISKAKHAKLIIAIHNNTDGKPLSVNSYSRKFVNAKMDTDDFVLTTEESIFKALKAKKINTVLETTATAKDDGSMAYYCSGKKIPYINVEAQVGHQEQQLKMLNALTDIIANYIK